MAKDGLGLLDRMRLQREYNYQRVRQGGRVAPRPVSCPLYRTILRIVAIRRARISL